MFGIREIALKHYQYRRGYIAVIDSRTGLTECLRCGATWWAMLRSGGYYRRGCWTCHACGANCKGNVSKRFEV